MKKNLTTLIVGSLFVMGLSIFFVPVQAQEVTSGSGSVRALSEGARIDALKNLISAMNAKINALQASVNTSVTTLNTKITSVQSCASSGKVWDGSSCVNTSFGGMWVNYSLWDKGCAGDYSGEQYSPNPVTGGYSCPAGYADHVVFPMSCSRIHLCLK